MKMFTRSRMCACVLAAGLLVSARVEMSAQTGDPFVGTWKLDVAKSKFTPGPAPKSLMATFSAAGAGFKAVIEGVGVKGDKTRFEYTANYDGKDHPMKGNPDGDAISVKRINANSVETTFKRAGKPTVVNTRTVSADGKTMTVTSKGTNAQGQTINNVQVFEKA